jgi:uracil-DNA glycosylase
MNGAFLPDHWPIDSDWTSVLQDHFALGSFQSLCGFVRQERQRHQVCPAAENVFQAFELCGFAETRVVILGQDPYHGMGQAHGLSFSVAHRFKIPPSLKNIFKELKADLAIENGEKGNLENWARQGVLLLNSVLTVRLHKANSHRNRGWEAFTDCVIKSIGMRQQPTVFLLWGNSAISKKPLIDADRHKIIESSHPSPLSARKSFIGSRPFSKANRFLQSQGLPTIDWRV